MDRVLEARGQRVTIVAATSGDTGGAAVEAFRGAERVDVVVLFPRGRISDVQRRMMTTATEANVRAVAVEGTFDDCQALVKAMFNDPAFRDRLQLAAVNSINWGRIVAQLTYYFVAGTALGSPNRPVQFSVPTGNFGDAFAGYCAKAMGLPAERLVIATNENDILHRAWSTGLYALSDVVATTSPSMDIQLSSNFERFLFEAGGRDAAFVRAKMNGLRQSRSFSLGEAMVPYRESFIAERVDQDAVADCIRRVKAESGYLLEPHSASAVVAARKTLTSRSRSIPHVALATAHPAKFPDTMQAITGERPPLPPRLADLMSAPERVAVLPNDLPAIQRFVEDRAGRKHGGAA
jgi:threonine synthase